MWIEKKKEKRKGGTYSFVVVEVRSLNGLSLAVLATNCPRTCYCGFLEGPISLW